MGGLFKDTKFLLVDTAENGEFSMAWMREIITKNSGSAISKTAELTKGCIEKHKITHIISSTYDFTEYSRALQLMIPVTSPQWLEDSDLAHQKRNYRLYSPAPSPFMDRVVLCIADNLPEGDREMMYAGVRAFGGQYLDALSRYTTHLIAVDLSNNKSVVAANVRQKEGLEIKIVLPQWIDDCIRQQRHVEEKPYLLSDPVVLQTGKPNFGSSTNYDDNSTPSAQKCDVLQGKNVYLACDYNLSEHLEDAVRSLIGLCGGNVVSVFDLGSINVYIGKYRRGSEFQKSCQAPKIDVGSLQWLYYIAVRQEYVPPLQSNLLHFPLPEEVIPGFRDMRISVTGYSGDARHYLASLITSMGGVFTKTLDCENNYLVTAKARGEKYAAAKSRWPDVHMVNHLWVEDCFSKWELLDSNCPRYCEIDDSTQILGKTKLQELSRWINENGDGLGVEDSMNEEGNPEAEISDHQLVSKGNDFHTASITQSPMLTPKEITQPTGTPEPAASLPIHSVVVVENISSSPAPGRTSRSAKQKATMKLHSDMEDLNQYTSMAKSSRKMKTYMDELERSMETPKKRSSESTPPPKLTQATSPVSEPPQKKKKVERAVHMVAIMTGCEHELVLNRAEVVKLAKVGISVVNDYSPKKPIDTIIAPRVLRTEKFLKCLSTAKHIVHPRYLAEILSRLSSSTDTTWDDLHKEYNIKDYYLDKVVPVRQINEELGVTGKASGLSHLLLSPNMVFEGMKVNLSSNLNGGPALIASILEAHGLAESKVVKLASNTSKKNLLSNSDGLVIVVAHKDKDKKAASHLSDVAVVGWDWCVKSIFHLEIGSFEAYEVK